MQQITSHRWFFVVLLHLAVLFAGCQPGFADYSDNVTTHVVNYKLPGTSGAGVWLDADTVAYLHSEEVDGSPEHRIMISDLGTGDWKELPLPQPLEVCSVTARTGVGILRWLPGGNLGFRYDCRLKTHGIKTALFMWDREADSIEMLYEYKDFFRADAFAFSPDMTRAIQGQGMGASDKLYWVSRTGELQQLLSDFQRVNDPAWSPDGTTIAFFGTETYPGGDPDDFISFSQTSDLLFYPWDLYLMDADGGNVRRVLERATTPGRLQWSHTDSGRLAFTGYYDDTPGIWIFDTGTGELSRIWPYTAAFSWSPDGRQIMVIDSRGEHDIEHPLIMDLPSELLSSGMEHDS